MRVLLLGVGMQGKAALHDLMESREVTEVIAADLNLDLLKSSIADRNYQNTTKLKCEYFNANNPESIENLFVHKPDIIIDLLPVKLHDIVTTIAIDKSVHLVNASYVTPGIKKISHKAIEKGITILPEFGMDPGIDLVLLGKAVQDFDTVEEVISYGAGFPEFDAADNPLKYKVTWNLEGVLKSYFRPASIIKNRKIITIKENELFNIENTHKIDISGLGTFEAFPNGNIREIVDKLNMRTSQFKKLGRYVLRWPGLFLNEAYSHQ